MEIERIDFKKAIEAALEQKPPETITYPLLYKRTMIKPRISGREARENRIPECFTKDTIELQLTYSVAFLSLMVDKFECPLGTNFKTKTFM